MSVLKSSRYAAVLLGAALAVAICVPPAGASSASRGPSLVPQMSHELDGVFCTSASNCWAVGSLTGANGAVLNQVLHWTGRKWRKVGVPNPGGTGKFSTSELIAVRCTSASNCWAVGNYFKNQAQLDQALHWNGKKWFVVSTPAPGGTATDDINQLDDVACTSAHSCWAVGSYGHQKESSSSESVLALNQALHWNGKKWSLISTPQPGGTAENHVNELFGVRCTSPGACWAGGTDGQVRKNNNSTLKSEMLHWNGHKWTRLTVPNPGGSGKGAFTQIDGLSCTSASDCWAVGEGGTFAMGPRFLNLALHWNGKKWFRVATPDPAGAKTGALDSLIAVTCVSASDCWAVGRIQGKSIKAFSLNQVLHWNGVKWSQVKVPNPAGTGTGSRQFLNSIRCVRKTGCWAVGVQQQSTMPQQNEILHWNGKKWTAS